jgi:hypothetical protein
MEGFTDSAKKGLENSSEEAFFGACAIEGFTDSAKKGLENSSEGAFFGACAIEGPRG